MEPLTDRQEKILYTIKSSIDEKGYPPSMQEIGIGSGLKSLASVAYQLNQLEKMGYIRRDPKRPRAMEVLIPDENKKPTANTIDPTQSTELQEPTSKEVQEKIIYIDSKASDQERSIPLVGKIAAGGPILAEQDIQDVMNLPEQLVGDGNLFLLTVQGDSMINSGIMDGDLVVVKEQNTASNGDIVAALLNDEATVKTLHHDQDHVWLLPQNSQYAPILGDEAKIMGKVVTVLRSLL